MIKIPFKTRRLKIISDIFDCTSGKVGGVFFWNSTEFAAKKLAKKLAFLTFAVAIVLSARGDIVDGFSEILSNDTWSYWNKLEICI